MMQKLTRDERMALTRATMNLLDDWGLQSAEMMTVLNMPESVKVRSLGKYRDSTPFPDDPHVMKRVHFLLRIAEALRTTYPRSPEMGKRWMRQGHRRFGRRSPLSLVVQGGENGLIRVLSELDCSYSWERTASTAATKRDPL